MPSFYFGHLAVSEQSPGQIRLSVIQLRAHTHAQLAHLMRCDLS